MVLAYIQNIALIIGMNLHPFYVSVCEIYHNPTTSSLEISMKIFIDDLELAIQKSSNPEFAISENANKSIVESEITNYLEDKFQIEIDSERPGQKLIGYELESDAIICYIEVENVDNIGSIKVQNSILTEVYSDQINLTHFQYKDQLKSLKTTKLNPEGRINTSSW